MTNIQSTLNLARRHQFGVLFVLLFCVILIPPYFENTPWIGSFWRVLFTLVLLWSLYAIGGSRNVVVLAVLFLIPTLLSTWMAGSLAQRYLFYIDNITNIAYFSLVCYLLARHILSARSVTLEVIFASMCLYVILAVLWGAIYANLYMYYDGSFTFYGLSAGEAGLDKEDLFQYMTYYSFVTLSTLGYGDIIPVHQVAQNWAAVEAMIGQFYIAIVIARLVSLYTIDETR